METKTQQKKSPLRGTIYPPPQGVTLSTAPNVYRGDLFVNWVRTRSTHELKELQELETLLRMLTRDENQPVFKKVANSQKLDALDMAYIRLIKELLTDIYRLKYGEKRVNVNTNFEDIRSLMWGKNDNPSGQ